MYQLIVLPNKRMAQAFIDYMATLDVRIKVRPLGDGVELFMETDLYLEQVHRELLLFMNNPMDKSYQEASWRTGKTDRYFSYPARGSYLQIIRQKAGPLTLAVMVICILFSVVMLLTGDWTLMRWFGFPQNHLQIQQIWRWITPIFMHFGIIHLSFNLVMWWYLGGLIELRQGSNKLLIIMLLSAVISNTAQYLSSGGNFGGLSGVVYALIGYSWLYGKRSSNQGIALDKPLMIFALVWLVMGYFDFLTSIANMAHFIGLMVGLIMAWLSTISCTKNN